MEKNRRDRWDAGRILLLILCGGLATVTPRLGMAEQNGRWAEGRILVQPRAGLAATELDGILGKRGGRSVRRIRQINVHLVEVPPRAEDAVARALARNSHIAFAEKDMLVSFGGTADDPRFPSQWHLPRIGAPTAWDTSLGSGIIIAVLDTGVNDQHLDLASRMVAGWNFYDDDDDTSDVHGHGTWVAGVAAAETNNGIGVASVAYDAQIMPVRIAGPDAYAYWSTVARGITWAADNGAKVANVSYNGVSGSSSVRAAAAYMRGKGGLVVVAAGNSGGRESISETADLISVSATTSSDTRASFSSWGEYVDLAAPGTSIVTTSRNGGYATVQGTSFSSPCVAGVAALIMAANPALAPTEVESILFETAVDLGAAGRDEVYGFGLVDAAAAVAVTVGAGGEDIQAPSVSVTSPAGGTVLGTVPVDVVASDDVGVTRVDLFVNDAFWASDTAEPYSFSWDSTTTFDGTASLVAHAFDAAGNEGRSETVTVMVDNVPEPTDVDPPTVAITSPAGGATVAGVVRVDVTAADDVGVTETELFVNEFSYSSDSTEPYGFDWDSTDGPDGLASLVVLAFDAAGNEGRSETVTVEVGNAPEPTDTMPPTVAITSPPEGDTVSGPQRIEAIADDDVGVALLEVWVDGEIQCVEPSDAVSCLWNTNQATTGFHAISARARDAAGNTGRADSWVIVVSPGGEIDGCWSDFDGDSDVDGGDLSVICLELGRTDCSEQSPCVSDFDGSGAVDAWDLSVWATRMGGLTCQ